MASPSPVTQLPPYFPTTKPACKEVSAKFFHCFTQNSRKISANDATAARRALATCQDELRAYMTCMERK